MKIPLWIGMATGLLAMVPGTPSHGACCYFSAKLKDIDQPGQKAFITWDPERRMETFTVQPKFEGNADDFGMVIPTPGQPKLDEMPREFFKALAVFTILEPMDEEKFPPVPFANGVVEDASSSSGYRSARRRISTVKVLESGIVGSLDYKIVTAERPDDLFDWLKAHKYKYKGDEDALDHYIKKKWFFTVMKIDTKQLKEKAGGKYQGELTPTRFQFASSKLIYPLKITQLSVKEETEALLYIQAPHKVDLSGAGSYQPSWTPMWRSAMGMAVPERLTAQEKRWLAHTKDESFDVPQPKAVRRLFKRKPDPVTAGRLEWAKKITAKDIGFLNGRKFNRDAPAEEVNKLKLLRGHVRQGQFITKVRKVFQKREMENDLLITRADVKGANDNIEYFSILPTSPP